MSRTRAGLLSALVLTFLAAAPACPAQGLIVSISSDGNIVVMDASGGSRGALTADAGKGTGALVVYALPTWSPDGSRVAFARFVVGETGEVTEASVAAWDRTSGRSTRLLSSARIQPFYLYWSPDSGSLGLLSSVDGEEQMELGIVGVGEGDRYRAVDRGAPLYWAWRRDSRAIAVHANTGSRGEADERLTLLDPGRVGARANVSVGPGTYQPPGYSPDGAGIVYALSTLDGFELHLRALDGSTDRTIARGPGSTYFVLSPDGGRVAYLQALSRDPLPVGRLSVVDLPGTAAPKTAQEVPALAFSWSPDGRTIAFLVPDMDAGPDPLFLDDEQALGVRLLCFDPATGRSWPVARFPPAPGTLGVIPFFDQYALSRTSWSPDGRSFVFSALSPDGRPGIYIVAADGSAPPSLLAPGDSASWSSR